MQLVAKGLGGRGQFESVFVLVAVGSVFPTFVLMWLPETLLVVFFSGDRASELGGFAFLPGWADVLRQLIVPAWTLGIYIQGLARIHGVSLPRAGLAVVLGMAPAVLLVLVFVR